MSGLVQSQFRRGQIDALRVLAVGFVLFDHYAMPEGSGPVGRLSVRLFLIISGYLITEILLRVRHEAEKAGSGLGQPLIAFYLRRLLRIAPAYMLVVGLTYALRPADFQGNALLWHASFQSSIIFALHDSWDLPWRLSHLWTLSVQEQFYLLWPLVVLFVPRRRLLALTLSLMLIDPVFRLTMAALGQQATVAAFTLLPASVSAIGVGAIAALLEQRSAVPKAFAAPDPPKWLAVGLCAFILACLIPHDFRWDYLALEYVWLAPLTGLLLSASQGMRGPLGRLLDQAWLQYLGRISLGIYLYQWLAYDAVAAFFSAGDPLIGRSLVRFVLVTPVCIAFAALSWTLLEQPVSRLRRLVPGTRRPRRTTIATARSQLISH